MSLYDKITTGIMIAALLLPVISATMKALGWKKGALIADELQKGLRKANSDIVAIRAGEPITSIQSISNTVAGQIKGVTGDDIKPIVEAAISEMPVDKFGVTVDLDPVTGDITVDPSGLVGRKAQKISKWLKKVF